MKFRLALTLLSLLVPAHGLTQEIKGAPYELWGYFGNNKEQCRSFNRKTDDITIIEKYTYSFCSGTMCFAQIRGHKKTPDGFILRFTSKGNPRGWKMRFIQFDKDIFDVIDEPKTKDSKLETIVRCNVNDSIAGIGLSTMPEGLTKAPDLAFSTYYALAVPRLCGHLEVDQKKAEELLRFAAEKYRAFLLTGPNAGSAPYAAEQLADQKEYADDAVGSDFMTIPEFCSHISSRFGPNGSIIKGLVSDFKKPI